jgi:hypothetical protein
MSFILRVYIIGLMAFVPSQDGKRMVVLMVDARDGYHATDGSFFPPHVPMLLARAASCKGDCEADLEAAAGSLLSGIAEQRAPRLRKALDGGTLWRIDGDDLAVLSPRMRGAASTGLEVVRRPAATGMRATSPAMPAQAADVADFGWVPKVSDVVSEAGDIDRDCLAPQPRKGLVVGRLALDRGTLRTYRMTEFYHDLQGGVPSFLYKPLAAGSAIVAPSSPSLAAARGIADWTVVDIPIQGCEVTLEAKSFRDPAAKPRTITLAPAQCKANQVVEVALINLPDQSLRDKLAENDHQHGPEGIASHFQIYYELAQSRPAWRERLVPVVTDQYVEPEKVGQEKETSLLLQALDLLGSGRGGTYSRPICTQAVFAASDAVRP